MNELIHTHGAMIWIVGTALIFVWYGWSANARSGGPPDMLVAMAPIWPLLVLIVAVLLPIVGLMKFGAWLRKRVAA